MEEALRRELCLGPTSKLENGGSGVGMHEEQEGVQKNCDDESAPKRGTLADLAAADPYSKAELGVQG